MEPLPVEFYLIALKHSVEKNNETCSNIKKTPKCVSMSFTAGFDHAEISIETSGELSPKFNCTLLWRHSTEMPPLCHGVGLPDPTIGSMEAFVKHIQQMIDLNRDPIIKSANKE